MTQPTYKSVFDAIYDEDVEKSAEMQFRSDLLMILRRIFENNGWSQKDIMVQLDIKQSRASELQREQISKFSSEKLIGYLAKAGFSLDTELDLREKTVRVQSTDIHAA